MARIGLLIGGVVLLVFGIILFGLGANILSEVNACLSGFLCNLGAGLYSLAGNNVLQNAQTEGYALEGFGGILGLVGLILLVVGAVSKGTPAAQVQQAPAPAPQPPMYSPQTQAQSDSKFCPSCGARLVKTAAFCPTCGAKQP